MKQIIENMNRILADWNPIAVDAQIATDEYKGYIPSILKHIENQPELLNCLEDILINKMEVGYDSTNEEHLRSLQSVCGRLMQVYQEYLSSNVSK